MIAWDMPIYLILAVGCLALNWYAFLAPGKTPPAILDAQNKELVAILSLPDVQQELMNHGMQPQPGSRADLARYIADESARYGKLIRERKISGEWPRRCGRTARRRRWWCRPRSARRRTGARRARAGCR